MLLNGLIMDISTVSPSFLDVMISLAGHSLAIISFILHRYGTLVLLVTFTHTEKYSAALFKLSLPDFVSGDKSSLMVSLMPKEELFQLEGRP